MPSLFLEMRKGKIDNTKLDTIGKTLVKLAFIRQADIEKIVADPHLFARVKAKISTEHTEELGPATLVLSRMFSFRTAIVGVIAALVIAAAASLSILDLGDKPVAVYEIQIPPHETEVARPLDPPQVDIGKLSQSRATNFESPRAERTVAIGSRTRRQRPIDRVEFDSDGEFYPVVYTGDIEEDTTGGRVIRVDMDRSSLFALGVNLPLENDAETFKADLIVGRDGVTRAVRLVK